MVNPTGLLCLEIAYGFGATLLDCAHYTLGKGFVVCMVEAGLGSELGSRMVLKWELLEVS